MNDMIKEIESAQLKESVPQFNVGDTVRVHNRIKEGNRERVQMFEGTVIKIQGGSSRQTFNAVVCLKKRNEPPADIPDEKMFFSLIRASFNQRRKTLINGLTNGSGLAFSKGDWLEMIESLGFDGNVRGEQLSLADFAALSKLVASKVK